ncbi:hypothetical protein AN958_10346 [Leucoagaricus sp. SymC.cos]|nr:hypothetical protein AN958_10346 [Leucoagaricus sp. SymC.cos]
MDNAPSELQAKIYPITLKKEELNVFVDENLKSGRIHVLKSQYAAPCFFIPKKDRSKWLVQDYQKINQYTVKDKTSISLISKVVD